MKYADVLLMAISLSISIIFITLMIIIYKIIKSKKEKFKVNINTNEFILQQKDNLTKWVKGTEKKMKKNNIKIKIKRYIALNIIFISILFFSSIYMFKNITASIFLSISFIVFPEYIINLIERRREMQILDQLVVAIGIFTSEYLQTYQIEKAFSAISIRVKDPVGLYFAGAYNDLIIGIKPDKVLSSLSNKFNSYLGKMFIQLIYQVRRNRSIINLFPELLTKVEKQVKLSRSNRTSLHGERILALIMALLPIPGYIFMSGIVPETRAFVTQTNLGRLLISLSFLSIFTFVFIDRFMGSVE